MKEKNVKNNKWQQLKFNGNLNSQFQSQNGLFFSRAYRGHLRRRHEIENRRLSAGQRREEEREHRRLRSAKRAQFVEQYLIDQTRFNQSIIHSFLISSISFRIRDENKEYEKMINDTGPSLQIYA